MFVVPKRESNCLNGVGKQRNTKKLLYCYPFVYLQALFMAMLHTKTITEFFDSEIAFSLAKLKRGKVLIFLSWTKILDQCVIFVKFIFGLWSEGGK